MSRRVCALVLSVALFSGAWSVAFRAAAANLEVEILPRFNGAPLIFDALTNRTAAGQTVSVTRLDFLISNVSFRRDDGAWLGLTNWQAYVSAREGPMSFRLTNIPNGRYAAVRFLVGVTPEVNKGDPAQYPAQHPLNPSVNGLHWGWQGGYVFIALEGDWRDGDRQSGYSFHIANDPQLMTVELPLALDLDSDHSLRLALDVARIFDARYRIPLAENSEATHSRIGDALAAQLHENVERAFSVEHLARRPLGSAKPGDVKPLVGPEATPYRLTVSSLFPRPALPLDNPLTAEGVELGRMLFNDRRLSVNNSQSCASCHDLGAAGADPGRAVSLGVEGKVGTRNAMPLFNLAWRNAFFWDGRAATLREQVLQPIENPIEMHETLTNVVSKLAATGRTGPGSSVPTAQSNAGSSGHGETHPANDYPALFSRAFGSTEISPDRIARALEQFLLTRVSHDSKFDRVLKGETKFTEEEQRGFELFHTEYDPRREQFGADCFHCHGGPLFQNVAFANNGLDLLPRDLGRFEATKREGDRGKFAVPSLRNVAVTGPYMHDGRFQTLEEVVEHYSTGVKRGATLDPNLAKHPDGGVALSAADKRALVAFLMTLTDEQFVGSRTSVVHLPETDRATRTIHQP